MAKKWCLLKPVAKEFIKRLKDGSISPGKLNAMTSQSRREFFSTFMDKESAKQTNILFEKKLLLKNQERGLIRWAEQLTGVSTKQREALLDRIKKTADERLRRTFSPEEEQTFLNDLVDSRLGLGVSQEEAKTIFALSKKVQEGSELFDKNKIFNRLSEIVGDLNGKDKSVIESFLSKLDATKKGKAIESGALRSIKKYLGGNKPSKETVEKIDQFIEDIVSARKDAIKYGAARVALDDFVGDIKLGIKTPLGFNMESAKKVIIDVAGFAKAAAASLDNSFIGRQGIKTLFSGHPVIWGKTFVKSFEVLAKSFGGKEALKGVRAEIYGRPNSMNGLYNDMKLAVGIAEEAYPTTLPEKIPLFGRFFKASQEAFTASAYYMRAELADELIRKRISQGIDMTDKENARSLGLLINSLTGRGDALIGKSGQVVNTVFFSPKFFQSTLDTLTAHAFDSNVKAADKIEAVKNLASIITSIGGILYLADTLKPGSVEWDPRSSDFGKIRIGDTRFDITGGMGSFVTLLARIAGGSKSSATGLITKPTDFGGSDVTTLIGKFTENKLSPFVGLLVDILKKEDFNGDPYTAQAFKDDPTEVTWRIVKNTIIPIPYRNAEQNFTKFDTDTALAITVIDALGIGANTYSFKNNWDKTMGKELSQFKDKVGAAKFKEENENFSVAVNDKLLRLRQDKRFQELSNENKKKVIEKVKEQEKDKIFSRNKFKPKREVNTSDTRTVNSIAKELMK